MDRFIFIADVGPLHTLAAARSLGLLMTTQTFVTDLVMMALETSLDQPENQEILEFLVQAMAQAGTPLSKVVTGVPDKLDLLRSLRVDPFSLSLKIALEDHAALHPGTLRLLLLDDSFIAKYAWVLSDSVKMLPTSQLMERFGVGI